MKRKLKRQSGLTMVELVIAMGLSIFVLTLAGLTFFSASKNTVKANSNADIWSEIKLASQQIRRDLQKAGFGMGGTQSLIEMDVDKISMKYKDMEGNGYVVQYVTIDNHTLKRKVWKNDIFSEKDIVQTKKDNVYLELMYQNEDGAGVNSSDDITKILFKIYVVPGANSDITDTISGGGKVYMVNNQPPPLTAPVPQSVIAGGRQDPNLTDNWGQ